MVSVIIPVYNCAELVEELHRQLEPILDELDDGAEVVFVDDGSADDTVERLRGLQRRDDRIRIVELVANFGQHAALSAGFEHARGSRLVTMDADLQCDPADLPRLVEPLRRGFDVVSGVRTGRRDPLARRAASWLVTRFVARMTGVRLRDVGCPYNALSSEVATHLAAFGELRRFLKPLGVMIADRVTEVEVAHRPRPRPRGQPRSSYSATGLIRLLMDFIVNALGDVYAWLFLVGGGTAAIAAVAAVAFGLAGSVGALRPETAIVGSVAALGLALGALGLAMFGLAGDYVQRIHRQSSGRPFYLVREVYEPEDGGDDGDRGGPS